MIVRRYDGHLVNLNRLDFDNDVLYYKKLIKIKFNIDIPEVSTTLDISKYIF